MARSIRIEYEGAYYHVMARGNRREAIFLDDEDRHFFLKTLSDVCEMTGWRVHAWVLMNNHYHLFIQTPEANLVEGMKWFQNTYTRRFNVRHKAWGRLFGDRYKAILIEGSNSYYYETLLDYIHLNPARAGLINANSQQTILDYPWSSLVHGYALPPNQRKPWMACREGLESYGLKDTPDGRRKMIAHLNKRVHEEQSSLPNESENKITRSWFWGTQEFAEKILIIAKNVLTKSRAQAYNSSSERKAHGLYQATIWLSEGLIHAKLSKEDLLAFKGSDPRKVFLALFLKKKTTMSNSWLSENLKMKSAANVSYHLQKSDIANLITRVPKELINFAKTQGFQI